MEAVAFARTMAVSMAFTRVIFAVVIDTVVVSYNDIISSVTYNDVFAITISDNTFSILYRISKIARLTSSSIITPGSTLITDLVASTFTSHPESVRAFVARAIGSIEITVWFLIVANFFGVGSDHHHAQYSKGFLF